MPFTLAASSAALFSTWFFVEELGVLFDAGDGVSAVLMQKTRKIRHIFITHADRDHVTGLLQLYQLNAQDGKPCIYYPRDSGSFPALKAFVEKFDPQSGPATWRSLAPGDVVDIGGNMVVKVDRSDHINAPGDQVKALRFTISNRKKVLRDQYRNLGGSEIVELKKKLGPDALTDEVAENLLGYSGDAPALDPSAWRDVRMLIHECTFLEPQKAKRSHACLPEVLQAAKALSLDALVLGHFSSRYSSAEITEAVSKESGRLGLSFPVHVVLPGKVSEDILGTTPVWQPAAAQSRANPAP